MNEKTLKSFRKYQKNLCPKYVKTTQSSKKSNWGLLFIILGQFIVNIGVGRLVGGVRF